MKPTHKKFIRETAQRPGLKERKIIWASAALIIVLGFIVYSNSLNGAFIWDDEYLIQNNIYIKSWSGFPDIFTKDIGAGVGHRFNFYRPLQMLTYIIDYSLWKSNVKGYHLGNVLFHILAALAIYWLITILSKDKLLSLITSLLFVVHPVHTEAVSYISGRSDSLALCFMLLTIIFYIRNLDAKRLSIYLCMIISYTGALLSRENSLILPVLLLLFHYTFRKKFSLKQFLPLAVLAGIYITLRMTLLDFRMPSPIPPGTFLQRLPGFFVAISNYFRLMVLPFGLHMEYANPLFGFAEPRAIIGIVLVLSLFLYL